MKFLVVLTKSRYRLAHLNNFSKNQKIGNYVVINLFSYFINIFFFLKFFKLIKFISVDECIKLPKNKGFNFWMTGTIHKIPDQRKKEKNFVNMRSVFHDKDNIFQLFPLKIKNTQFRKERKIIYAGNYELRNSKKSYDIWNQVKNFCEDNINYIDNKSYWNLDISDQEKFHIYRDLKNFQRKLIIEKVFKNFQNHLQIYGKVWTSIFHKEIEDINDSDLKKKYSGNICLDFGSKCGSLTLYPRSISIIESGGLLLQLEQLDSKKIFGQYLKNFTFCNFQELNSLLNLYLFNKEIYKKNINIQKQLFKLSENKIENQLDRILY